MRLGRIGSGHAAQDQTARRAYDLLAEGFGPGFNGPIPIVVDVNGDEGAAQRIYDGVQGLEGVASAGEPQFNDAKTVAIVFVTPDSAPQDEATSDLVTRLRSDVVPAAIEGGDAVAYVSGLTAAFTDIADRIYERLPLFLLYIIGVTFIVLAMAFRSIVISLTAAVDDASCRPSSASACSRSSSRRATCSGADRPRPDGSDRDEHGRLPRDRVLHRRMQKRSVVAEWTLTSPRRDPIRATRLPHRRRRAWQRSTRFSCRW